MLNARAAVYNTPVTLPPVGRPRRRQLQRRHLCNRPLWNLGCAVAIAAGGWLWGSYSAAQDGAGEFPEEGAAEPSPRPQSLKVLHADAPIYTLPDPSSPRRGAAQKYARLPLYTSRHSVGCSTQWFLVGPSAWICGEHALPDHLPPLAVAPAQTFESGLPLSYHFVNEGGTLAYRKLADVDVGVEDQELEGGFAVALFQTARARSGAEVGVTTHELWVHLDELHPANPSALVGTQLPPSPPAVSVGWVHGERARVYSAPGDAGKPAFLRHHASVEVFERRTHRKQEWLRIGEDRWLTAEDARVWTRVAPPTSVMEAERWIDVDTAAQIATAYEGSQPVFATLVSTGKGRAETELATPLGEHRIWVKLAVSDMDNLEDAKASRYYAMQAVPWVMFFHKGYGLHGAYWHNSFGKVRSQGCVNLAPRDAQRLFHWAGPRLPPGWSAVLPTQHDPGTRVVVR